METAPLLERSARSKVSRWRRSQAAAGEQAPAFAEIGQPRRSVGRISTSRGIGRGQQPARAQFRGGARTPAHYVTSRFAAQTDTYWSERDCVSLCITEVIVFIQNE